MARRTADGLANGDIRHSSRPLRDIVRANVLTPFNALLGTLALLVMVTGAVGDALFGLLLVVNSAIGIIQELRAKRTLDRLAVLSDPRARVVRNGSMSEIAVDDVVLDDLVEFRPGDQVPADCCVRHVDGLEIDESLVTGESDPVAKQPGDAVLSGSTVIAGSGTAQVTAVGADSFANRLTDEAREFSLVRSELTEGINRILKYVAISLAVVGPILFISQSSTTSSWQDAVRGAVAGLVGMVPEGLVLLTSVTFFAAALSLARRRVLVRELPAVEGLARIDMLCLDKTGTLTEGQIAFTGVEPFGTSLCEVDEALAALAEDRAGNATVVALRQVFPTPPGWEKLAAVPFSSARKWSATSFDGHGTWVLGAPEIMLAGAPADDHVRRRVETLAAAGTRTLLLARSNAPLPVPSSGPGDASSCRSRSSSRCRPTWSPSRSSPSRSVSAPTPPTRSGISPPRGCRSRSSRATTRPPLAPSPAGSICRARPSRWTPATFRPTRPSWRRCSTNGPSSAESPRNRSGPSSTASNPSVTSWP